MQREKRLSVGLSTAKPPTEAAGPIRRPAEWAVKEAGDDVSHPRSSSGPMAARSP